MKDIKMQLPKVTLDDLFTTQEEKDNKNMEKIVEIPIKEISDFPNHPYKVIDNEEMLELSRSIKENGLYMPVIVRQKKNGGYEMISGHRRKRATELAGINKIKAILTRKEQQWLLDSMKYNDATPSLAQAIEMKRKSRDKTLDEDEIELIMSMEKTNQIEKFKIDKEKIQNPFNTYYILKRKILISGFKIE